MKRAPRSNAERKTRAFVRAVKVERKRLYDETLGAARTRARSSDVDIRVNPAALAPYKRKPLFVARGHYLDEPFTCRDCGKPQVWTATQQKWWYEVMKAPVYMRASRCRPCRRAHRAAAERSRQLQVAQRAGTSC
ncbi:MAG: zinc-ribbon domain containing protein [Gammaproteobacteria bacterium]|nr:zinc-ribbon domain containing protein [Gammaproteobacteria bacterium]